MPIDSNAKYVHAHLLKAMAAGMTIDEDYIVMSPNAPSMDIAQNFAGWNKSKNRCAVEGKVLFSASIPQSFNVDPETWDVATPNAGLAVLMPDGRTIKQTQPFAHCSSGKSATSQYIFDDLDIYGEGLYGARGGSGLSAIGGTLRFRELTPTSDPIRHALKVNICAKNNVYYDSGTKGFRWPGKSSDGYAAGNYYKDRHSEIVMDRIFLNLHVIENNLPETVGGGGKPQMPMTPKFEKQENYILYRISFSQISNFLDSVWKNWCQS